LHEQVVPPAAPPGGEPPEVRLNLSDVLAASKGTAARQPCAPALTDCPMWDFGPREVLKLR